MPEFKGFIGAAYEARSAYQDSQRCINLFPEMDPVAGAKAVSALYPTEGLTVAAGVPSIAGVYTRGVRALYTVSGGSYCVAVVGNVVVMLDATMKQTIVGNMATDAGPVSVADNGIHVMLVDGLYRYGFTIGTPGGGLQYLHDGGWEGADRVSYLDGRFIYNRPDTNQFAISNLLSLVSDPTQFSSKDGNSDDLVSLIANNREVWLIGERTFEVWYDSGAFPFPFVRMQGATGEHGIAAAHSLTRLGESVAWLAKDGRGQGVAVMLNGFNPVRISTHAVEYAWSQYRQDDAIAYTYQRAGHEFYVLTFPSDDATWVFDLATGLWHERAWRDDLNVLHRHRSNCSAFFQGRTLVGDWEVGKIYELDPFSYTDAGQAIPRIRRAPHIQVNDRKRQFVHDLQVEFQPGIGLPTGQGQTPRAMLRWSDDGGSLWSNEHWVDIGAQGHYKNRAIWRRLGMARDRVFEVSVSDPVNVVMIGSTLNLSPGMS